MQNILKHRMYENTRCVYILFTHRQKLTDGSYHVNEGGLEMIMVSIVASAAFMSWSVVCSNQIDLRERLKNVNKTHFMLQKFFENKNIPKKLKLRLKNTTIDKTLTYALETGTLTKRDRKQLNILKGKSV